MAEFDYQILNQFSDTIRTIYPRMHLESTFEGSILQMGYLHFILDHNPCCQQDLVNMRIGSKAAISEMLSGMEEQGWITRKRNKANHRKYDIHLTRAGMETAQIIKNEYIRFCEQCLNDFSAEEREQLQTLLRKFLAGRPET